MTQIWLKKKSQLLLVFAMLFLASCMDKFDDDYTWESSVSNVQLVNPNEIKTTFSPDGVSQTITWSMVLGAGGYEATVYNADVPDNLKVIGDSARFVDGFSLTVPATEDTRYFVRVRTLGNQKMNNTAPAAGTFTELNYNNLVIAYATIPEGDLTAYFASNPVPQDSLHALAYELVEGGNYTMSGSVNVGGRDVVFRSDKTNPAKIVISANSGFMTSGGMLRLHYLDIDHTGDFGNPPYSTYAIVRLNALPAPIAGEGRVGTGGSAIIPSIVIRGCKITNIRGRILTGGGTTAATRYGVGAVIIENSLLGFYGAFGTNGFIEHTGVTKDITITGSTLYNSAPNNPAVGAEGQERFWRQSVAVADAGVTAWGGQSITMHNNTFFQIGPKSQSGNATTAGASRVADIRNNVFINSLGAGWGVVHELGGRSATPVSSNNNTTWYDPRYAGFGVGDNPARVFEYSIHGINGSERTSNINPIITDPLFEVNFTDSRNPVFSMGASTLQVRRKTGDPRWLPQQ